MACALLGLRGLAEVALNQDWSKLEFCGLGFSGFRDVGFRVQGLRQNLKPRNLSNHVLL